MSALSIAVIGDHFMKPDYFIDALRRIENAELAFRTLQQDWPDTPLTHGYGDDLPVELQGLKEFMGEPAEIATFIADAEVFG